MTRQVEEFKTTQDREAVLGKRNQPDPAVTKLGTKSIGSYFQAKRPRTNTYDAVSSVAESVRDENIEDQGVLEPEPIID